MLKFCIEQWDKNKDRLQEDIENNFEYYNNASYYGLAVKVVDLIFNDEGNDYGDKLIQKTLLKLTTGLSRNIVIWA